MCASSARPSAGVAAAFAMMMAIAWPMGCGSGAKEPPPPSTQADRPGVKSTDKAASAATAAAKSDDQWILKRRKLVEQLEQRGVSDESVLEAMDKVPRHLYVPESVRERAYDNEPLPIGYDQTISQPEIVALMTQLARPRKTSKALDIGTGSGYQAAILAELVEKVYSIEIVCELADEAKARLTEQGYKNIEVICGDGYRGWQEHAPFDIIILAASVNHIPQPLIDQLAANGRLILPVGGRQQELTVIEKHADGTTRQWTIAPVRFVPMTGEAKAKSKARNPGELRR